MRCPDSLALLQRRLDGEPVAGDTALDRHLAECPACRERHAAADRLLGEGLPALKIDPPTALWTGRVVATLLDDQRRLRRRTLLRAATAVAAALLLAVLAGWYATRPTPAPVPGPEQQARNQSDPESTPSVGKTVAEAGSAVKSLTSRIADQTVEQVRTILAVSAPTEVGPMPTMPSVAAIEQPLDPAARSLQETGRGVSTGLQMVTNSARRAFDFFVRELPPVQQ
jgi:predicted anti-sigma-YlaC factor YlaD